MRLTFLGDTPTPTRKPRWAVYACECGWIGKKLKSNVAQGYTKSCGCARTEVTAARVTTHGLTKGGASPEVTAWYSMRTRCTDSSHPSWNNYGGRGITVCERWNSLENFLVDMGPRPPSTSLERKDNEKGYSPGNCVWATSREQANNKRTTRRFEWNGQWLTIAALAEVSGVAENTIRSRLSQHWSIERILTQRKGTRRRNKKDVH